MKIELISYCNPVLARMSCFSDYTPGGQNMQHMRLIKGSNESTICPMEVNFGHLMAPEARNQVHHQCVKPSVQLWLKSLRTQIFNTYFGFLYRKPFKGQLVLQLHQTFAYVFIAVASTAIKVIFYKYCGDL